MVNVHDVAAYILKKIGSITTGKLQKLIYYCQSWHLVWEEKPLFTEKIEAGDSGPVIRALFEENHNIFEVSEWNLGNQLKLNNSEAETIDAVLEYYFPMTAQQLRGLVQLEDPWKLAHKNAIEITHKSLFEYYSKIPVDSTNRNILKMSEMQLNNLMRLIQDLKNNVHDLKDGIKDIKKDLKTIAGKLEK